MTLPPWLAVLLVLMLVAFQAILSGMYYALLNARKKALKEVGEKNPRRLQATLALAEESLLLLTTQQFTTIVLAMLLMAVLNLVGLPPLAKALTELGRSNPQVSNLLAGAVLLLPSSLVLLLVGHYLPAAILAGRPEGFALFSTPILGRLLTLIRPFVQVAWTISQRLGVLLGGAGERYRVTEEEIKTLVDAGSEEGTIDADEKDLIYSVLKFSDTSVRQIMVPRIDIVALDLNTSLEEALKTIIRAGHSRIPIYEETIDNIKGFLHAKDLLTFVHHDHQPQKRLADILREPYFVPEGKRAYDLLEELRRRKTHVAIVIDEYGGTAGLVTIEDLLEEIVGDIQDEYDAAEEADYVQISEEEYIFSAAIDLDDLNEILGADLPTDNDDTLGGYVFTTLEQVPAVGAKLTAHGLEMEVLALKGLRRLDKVRVRKTSTSEVVSSNLALASSK
jgi:CBS domain containing-hemolysin-like protein